MNYLATNMDDRTYSTNTGFSAILTGLVYVRKSMLNQIQLLRQWRCVDV